MFCWTEKLKEVMNKQILLASVPEAAVLDCIPDYPTYLLYIVPLFLAVPCV